MLRITEMAVKENGTSVTFCLQGAIFPTISILLQETFSFIQKGLLKYKKRCLKNVHIGLTTAHLSYKPTNFNCARTRWHKRATQTNFSIRF